MEDVVEEVAPAADVAPAGDDLERLYAAMRKAPDEHARSAIQARIIRLENSRNSYNTFTT